MSEAKPTRTIPEIQAQYQSLCTRLGHVQYQVFTHQKDIETINSTLRDLNLEAASVQAAENKAKEAELAAPPTEAELAAPPTEAPSSQGDLVNA